MVDRRRHSQAVTGTDYDGAIADSATCAGSRRECKGADIFLA